MTVKGVAMVSSSPSASTQQSVMIVNNVPERIVVEHSDQSSSHKLDVKILLESHHSDQSNMYESTSS
jgi:hypothetical protein